MARTVYGCPQKMDVKECWPKRQRNRSSIAPLGRSVFDFHVAQSARGRGRRPAPGGCRFVTTKSHNGTAEWPMTMCQLAVPSAICEARMSLAVFLTGDVPAGHNYVTTDREPVRVRSTSPQSPQPGAENLWAP